MCVKVITVPVHYIFLDTLLKCRQTIRNLRALPNIPSFREQYRPQVISMHACYVRLRTR